MADSASLLVADMLSRTLRLLDIPAATQAAAEVTATTDVIGSSIVQRRFENAIPELLSQPERRTRPSARCTSCRRCHSRPASFSGRVGSPDVHSTPLTYERVNGTNRTSLEVTR